MDVFFMVRRKNMTIFLDAKETTTISEVKKMIEGITKVKPSDMRLYKDEEPMQDDKCLADYGYLTTTAKAQSPATIGLVYRITDGNMNEFEPLEITPLSVPPELPDVMKSQTDNANSHPQEQPCN